MMKKRVSDQFWFPFWVDKWIFGSMRIECTLEERAIWVDLLALASKDEGYIRANEETPYPLKQLAGMLIVPEDTLKKAINKFVKLGKIKREKNKTLYITKWDKYQFSDRWKREVEKDSSAKTEVSSKITEPIIDNSTLNHNKLNDSKEKLNISFTEEIEITTELKTVKGIGEKKRNEIILYLRELSVEFPDIDYVYQMKKKCAWWRDNPLNKKSNIHLQIRNWFELAKKFQKESDQDKRVGESTHMPSTKEDDYTKARATKMKELEKKYQLEIEKATRAKSTDWLGEIENKMKEEIAEFSRKYKEE